MSEQQIPTNSIAFIPDDIRDFELYPKLAELVDHVVQNAVEDFEDVKFKHFGGDLVREEVIKQIIEEQGYADSRVRCPGRRAAVGAGVERSIETGGS